MKLVCCLYRVSTKKQVDKNGIEKDTVHIRAIILLA